MIYLHAPPTTEIERDVAGHVEAFNLARDTLGEKLLDETRDDILDHAAMEAEPDNTPWADLCDWYEEWKQNIAPGAPIGVLTGLMLSDAEMTGVRRITADEATMTYGVTAAAREEAWKFQEGGAVTGTNQPQRPFFYIGPDCEAKAASTLDAAFAKAVP